MLLECPSCRAKFNVPDGAIPPAGRTVRCSSCKHQWHAMTPPPEPEAPFVPVDHSFLEELAKATDAPDETITVAAEAEIPPIVEAVVIKPTTTTAKPIKKSFAFPFPIWPFKLAAPSLALVWIVLAMLAYFPSWTEGPLGGLYGSFGVVPTDGVVLADVAMQRQQEGQRTRFLISGNIVNQEAAERTVPSVRVQMLGNDNKVIWAREYEVDKTLKPGEIYPFRITNAETSFAHNVAQLVVDVGHPLQMMFR